MSIVSGFANEPGKTGVLADADVVIDDVRVIAEQLRDVPPPQ